MLGRLNREGRALRYQPMGEGAGNRTSPVRAGQASPSDLTDEQLISKISLHGNRAKILKKTSKGVHKKDALPAAVGRLCSKNKEFQSAVDAMIEQKFQKDITAGDMRDKNAMLFFHNLNKLSKSLSAEDLSNLSHTLQSSDDLQKRNFKEGGVLDTALRDAMKDAGIIYEDALTIAVKKEKDKEKIIPRIFDTSLETMSMDSDSRSDQFAAAIRLLCTGDKGFIEAVDKAIAKRFSKFPIRHTKKEIKVMTFFHNLSQVCKKEDVNLTGVFDTLLSKNSLSQLQGKQPEGKDTPEFILRTFMEGEHVPYKNSETLKNNYSENRKYEAIARKICSHTVGGEGEDTEIKIPKAQAFSQAVDLLCKDKNEDFQNILGRKIEKLTNNAFKGGGAIDFDGMIFFYNLNKLSQESGELNLSELAQDLKGAIRPENRNFRKQEGENGPRGILSQFMKDKEIPFEGRKALRKKYESWYKPYILSRRHLSRNPAEVPVKMAYHALGGGKPKEQKEQGNDSWMQGIMKPEL